VIVQHLLGSSLGPPFIGALSDSMGIERALLFLPVFLLVAGALFFVGSSTMKAIEEGGAD
jgi:4-hydroxybenzoate polyprenyltransferase